MIALINYWGERPIGGGLGTPLKVATKKLVLVPSDKRKWVIDLYWQIELVHGSVFSWRFVHFVYRVHVSCHSEALGDLRLEVTIEDDTDRQDSTKVGDEKQQQQQDHRTRMTFSFWYIVCTEFLFDYRRFVCCWLSLSPKIPHHHQSHASSAIVNSKRSCQRRNGVEI